MPAPDPAQDQLIREARFAGIAGDHRFAMSLEWRQDILHLVIEGAVTQALPDAFMNKVDQAVTALGRPPSAIDFTRCVHLSSMVLAYLVSFIKLTRQNASARIPVYGANARVQTLLKMVGLTDFFVMVPDAAAAAAHHAKAGATPA
jgi:anti-anti-sigma regulatory factor